MPPARSAATDLKNRQILNCDIPMTRAGCFVGPSGVQ